MTNRERLSQMSDEELAVWLSKIGQYLHTYDDGDDDDWDYEIDEYILPDIDGGASMTFYGGANPYELADWLRDEYGGDSYAN